MLMFFNMVLNGLGILFAFFGKWANFSNSASILTNLRLLTRRTLYLGIIALLGIYIALEIAFYYFTAESIVTAYNMISNLLTRTTTLQNSSGSSALAQPLFLILHSSGVAAGLNTAFPFIASAIIFRLMKALYLIINHLHQRMIWLYLESIKMITGA